MLRFDEMRRALRLANELRDLPRGSEAQRRHALDGLCGLLGACVGLWLTADGVDSGQVLIREAIDVGFEAPRGRDLFRDYVRETQVTVPDPSLPRFAEAVRRGVRTGARPALMSDREWVESAHVREIRRTAGVCEFVYSVRPEGLGRARVLSFHRPWGEAPFGERESGLLDVFHAECAWLHDPPGLPPALLRGLSPRLAETLRRLARGQSEKEIAWDLGISPHTVHEYAKALHRHFGVRSRGELLALAVSGG
jgi:DNA-binding CsgD family transcriptional regulator